MGGADRVVHVQVGDLIGADQQARDDTGQVHQDTGADGVQLADVAEGVGAQVGAQRGRRPRPGEQLVHPAVPDDLHVLEAVRAGDHARDQRSDLEVCVGAGRAGHGDVLGDQVCQPGFLGQRHDRDQARRADQVRVIENGGDVVADSHYRVLLSSGRSEPW